MADWRARNFVPDSDEEDGEEISQKSLEIGGTIAHQQGNQLGLQIREEAAPDSPYQDRDNAQNVEEEARQRLTKNEDKHIPETSRSGELGFSMDLDDSEDELALPAPKSLISKQQSMMPLNRLFSSDVPLDEDTRDSEQAPEPSREERSLSSDLSSISSLSPPGSPRVTGAATNEAVISRNNQPVVLIERSNAGSETNDRASRRFRQRKAIQLNPYAIEGQQYRDSLKSRGLKPINIQQFHQPETQESAGVDAHGSGNESFTSEPANSQTPSSSPVLNRESQVLFASPSSPPTNQDEFPDVNALLRKPLEGTVHDGFKRRKTTHTYTKKRDLPNAAQKRKRLCSPQNSGSFKFPRGFNGNSHSEGNPRPQSGQSSKDRLPSTVTALDRSVNFQQLSRIPSDSALPSPVPTDPSQSTNAFDDQPTFEVVPPLTTPPQLQTPATSSEQKREARIPARVQVLVDSQSDTDADDGVQAISDGASDRTSEPEGYRELMRAQRRTRGVLPASWHRLNYRNQREKVVKSQLPRRSSLHSPAVSPRKGVARPVSSFKPFRTDPSSGDHWMSTFGTDEDSESQSEQGLNPSTEFPQSITPFLQPQDRETIELLSSDDDDNMEMDSVDAMLGSRSRSSALPKKRRKTRQPKITDVLRNRRGSGVETMLEKDDSYRRGTRTRVPNQGKRTKTRALGGKNLKAIKRREHMSILDVVNVSDRAMTPNFIMIASRTAKQRSNKGRHSPTKKVFQLQNREDTNAVQESLLKWKKGDVVRRKQLQPPRQREPLTERTANSTPDSTSTQKSRTSSAHFARSQRQPLRLTNDILAVPGGHSGVGLAPISKFRDLVRSNGVAIAKKITSSVKPTRSYVPAQLETQRNRSGRVSVRRTLPKDLLERYLEASPVRPTSSSSIARTRLQIEEPVPARSRRRKRTPRQATPEILQLTDDGPYPNAEDGAADPSFVGEGRIKSPLRTSSDILKGFGRIGTEYTSTFNVQYLPDGALFDVNTFLGSCHFSRCLPPYAFPLDASVSLPSANTSTAHWQNWNETVSEQISEFLHRATECLHNLAPDLKSGSKEEDESIHSLTYVTRYLSVDLRFLDPIDRRLLVDRLNAWLLVAVDALQEALDTKIFKADSRRFAVSISARILVLAHQVKGIAGNELVSQNSQAEAATLLSNALRQAVRALFQNGCADLSLFTHETVRFSNHISRQTAKASVEAFVIIRHTLEKADPSRSIWDLLQTEGVFRLRDNEYDVQALDRIWSRVFSLLPFFDIDARGSVQRQDDNTSRPANWKLIKSLSKPILDCRLDDATNPRSTFNDYCRAILGRCLHLIQYWKWMECEGIITHLFDFFARNNLGDLPFEENRGSPLFLERLTDRSVLRPEPRDRCFQIFLKIVGTGLRSLRSVSSNKRIANCVFRLTPNHGRRLPKDQDIRQNELDAVRNHFDLLCTLYWAAPSGHRLRLDVIQNLLDVEESHRQACHLVIRSWSCLVDYQLSTLESVSTLDPFIKWFDEVLEKAIGLHGLARTEVENDAKAAERALGHFVPQDTRESVVASSQRHVEAIIMDALCSLKRAITEATISAAFVKLLPASLAKVLLLFDPKHPRVNKVIISCLEVIQTYTTRSQTFNESEDSQGFGDWSAFEELDPEIAGSGPITVDASIYKALRDLLSNAFGSDESADDSVLQSIAETWLSVAKLEVAAGNKSWDNYVAAYGQDSWKVLRSTEQTRRFTPFFFATLMEFDDGIYDNCKDLFLKEWAASLVERESLIKFQPLLTASLLNKNASEPLLDNPPFWRNKANDKFEISIEDFSERRLALLSCFLSNMRESVSFMTYHSWPERAATTRSYAAMLQNLMNNMKGNYQSLGEGSDVQGAYVFFVQKTVELLQQHTADICKVDPFFTDASNFPLPDHDPEYIVGSLKNLGLRLDLSGGLHKLSSFLQTLCERASIEDKQGYYSSLLQIAMAETLDLRTPDRASLCSSIFGIIFPIYADSALSSPCGWIIATPILQAIPLVLDSLFFHLNSFHEPSLRATESILLSVLHSIHHSCTVFLYNAQLLQQAHPYRILTCYLTILISILEPLKHLHRIENSPSKAGPTILQNIRDFILFLLGVDVHQNSDPSSIADSLDLPSPPQLPSSIRPAHTFARDQLRDSLDPVSRRCKGKVDAQGRYLFLRSGRWEEVKVKLGTYEEEKEVFVERAKEFVARVENMSGLGIRKADVKIDVSRPGQDLGRAVGIGGLDEWMF